MLIKGAGRVDVAQIIISLREIPCFSSSFHLFISCPILYCEKSAQVQKYYQLFFWLLVFCCFLFTFFMRDLSCRHQSHIFFRNFSFSKMSNAKKICKLSVIFSITVSLLLLRFFEHGKPHFLNFYTHFSTCSQVFASCSVWWWVTTDLNQSWKI